jgi:hypothetical protein
VLEAIDPTTGCPTSEVRFVVAEPDVADLCEIVGVQPSDLDAFCDLEPEEFMRLTRRFGIVFDADPNSVRLRPWHLLDDLPYRVHTGCELALMLAGTKPLAIFSDRYPAKPETEDIPERFFDPHVATGRLVKREYVEPAEMLSFSVVPGIRGIRHVLYALPGHEWRMDAFILLHDAASRSGWSEALERLEGALLGYESWQINVFIEQIYRPSRKAGQP